MSNHERTSERFECYLAWVDRLESDGWPKAKKISLTYGWSIWSWMGGLKAAMKPTRKLHVELNQNGWR